MLILMIIAALCLLPGLFAIKICGLWLGLLYFACSLCCGAFLLLMVCAYKESRRTDEEISKEWP